MGKTRGEKRQKHQEVKPEQRTCSIEGCLKKFTPGIDGTDDKCSMHYHRARRGSKHANVPFSIRGEAGQSETIKVLVSPALKKHLEHEAGAVGLSGYARRALAKASGWKG